MVIESGISVLESGTTLSKPAFTETCGAVGAALAAIANPAAASHAEKPFVILLISAQNTFLSGVKQETVVCSGENPPMIYQPFEEKEQGGSDDQVAPVFFIDVLECRG